MVPSKPQVSSITAYKMEGEGEREREIKTTNYVDNNCL